MSSYFTLCDDMDQLKAQMNILMSHLKQNEIITDEMVRFSVQKRMKKILPGRIKQYAVMLLVAVLMPCYLIAMMHFGKITSVPFVATTIAMCWYSAFSMYYSKYNELRNVCKDGALTEVATQVARLRRKNILFSILTPLVLIVWCVVYFTEYYQDLLTEHNGLFMAIFIIMIVTADIVFGAYRIHRVTSDVLDEIKSLKKE